MEIIYITNSKIPTLKANGLQVVKSCEAFAQNSAKITLIVPFRVNDIKSDPFEYYGVKTKFTLKRVWSLDLFKKKRLPSKFVFYLHAIIFSFLAVFLVWLKFNRKAIYYSRDYITLAFMSFFGFRPVAEIHDYRSSKPKPIIKFIFSRAQRIVANSEGTLDLLKRHYDFDEKKALSIHNGVDLDFFEVAETREEARELLNLPQNKTIIGYTGRLENVGVEKGVDYLIEAFKILTEKRDDLVLCVVGGPDVMAKNYREKAIAGGISPEKIIFTGYVEYRKVPLYLRAIDIVVIPLPKTAHAVTTSPIKLFEYLAAGKTIVASDFPSIRKYLNDQNALFFEPENIDDLATKLALAANDKSLAQKIADQAKNDSQKYSWRQRAQKILDFIK